MKRVKPSELKIGDIVNVYQERGLCKTDLEIQFIQEIERPVKYDLGMKFYLICFKDTYTDGKNYTDIVLREDRTINLVTVQDQIKGAEKYLIESCGYSRQEMADLRYCIDFTCESEYLEALQKEINALEADAWER